MSEPSLPELPSLDEALPSLPGLEELPELEQLDPLPLLDEPGALPNLEPLDELPDLAPITEAKHAVAIPSGPHPMQDRSDPYWDRLWAPGSQSVWATGSGTRARSDMGMSAPKFVPSLEDAVTTLEADKHRERRLALLSLLDSWGTVTAQQAAAFTGHQQLLRPNDSQVAAAFSAGLLDLGRFVSSMQRVDLDPAAAVYRNGMTNGARKLLADTLTFPELLQIDGGFQGPGAGYYDRHNILAAELALRASEMLPEIEMVLGEKWANSSLIFPTDDRPRGYGEWQKQPPARGDGALIRADGLRIILEMTATTSPGFVRKVKRWARILDEHPLETSGLVVLFVAAAHPDRAGGNATATIEGTVRRTINDVLKGYRERGIDSPAARMGFASWTDWFPQRHQASEMFMNLDVQFPQGGWHVESLLHEYKFDRWETLDAQAVIDQGRILAATPHWLRAGEHTHLIGSPMDRAGLEVPVPPAQNEKFNTEDRSLQGARGSAGEIGLPQRLRIIGRSFA